MQATSFASKSIQFSLLSQVQGVQGVQGVPWLSAEALLTKLVPLVQLGDVERMIFRCPLGTAVATVTKVCTINTFPASPSINRSWEKTMHRNHMRSIAVAFFMEQARSMSTSTIANLRSLHKLSLRLPCSFWKVSMEVCFVWQRAAKAHLLWNGPGLRQREATRQSTRCTRHLKRRQFQTWISRSKMPFHRHFRAAKGKFLGFISRRTVHTKICWPVNLTEEPRISTSHINFLFTACGIARSTTADGSIDSGITVWASLDIGLLATEYWLRAPSGVFQGRRYFQWVIVPTAFAVRRHFGTKKGNLKTS